MTGGAFARADEGQALVVVGLAMVVLMGALALAVDWGYGLSVRRLVQNQADAAALAAGRLLASSYVGGNPAFEVTEDAAWCAARDARDANASGAASSTTPTLEISFSSDGSAWTAPLSSAADCTSTAGGAEIPNTTVYVQVRSSARFLSLFGLATRQQVDAGASSWVRLAAGAAVRPLQLPEPRLGDETEVPGVGLSGSTTAPNVAIWPLALHYTSSLLRQPCGQNCDDRSRLVQFWPAQRFGGFHGLVSFGHDSLRTLYAHQLVTESDYRGTAEGDQGHPAVAPLTNASDQAICGGANWDTQGSTGIAADPQAQTSAVKCDLPNWFYYGYGGSISLGTDWWSNGWAPYRGAVKIPSQLTAPRSSCDAPSYIPQQSCTDQGPASALGDWVETINTPGLGDLTPNMAKRMREFIARYGRDAAGTSNGLNGLGKAVVVHVLIWDCAESFDGNGWNLIFRGNDPADEDRCADIRPRDVRATPVDRVHVFSIVPFTFYENLIEISTDGSSVTKVTAYWGDAFGQPGFYRSGGTYASCATDPSPAACQLNPLMNSAFLVADPRP